jgi:formylmethanofuran dehydrogenase subunit A
VISNSLQIAPRDIQQTLNLEQIGRTYARMGYTMAVEPAVPPLFAKQAVMELEDIPIIDKAFYVLLGNNWLMMEYVKEGLLDKLSTYISWLLRNVKGFAVKLANPGGGELWSWRGDLQNLDDVVPYFNVTPREIIETTMKANERIGLPHSVHLHCNNTLRPGNVSTTLDSIKMADAVEVGNAERKQTMHIAHAQYNCYGGEDWDSIQSRAEEVAKAINSTDKITADLGQITFGQTVFVSPDGCLTERIARLFKETTVTNSEFEIEDTSGGVKLTYSKDDPISSFLWATGLELALLIHDPWKLSLTSNSPSGGLFSRYPEIISWLMNREEREKILKESEPFLQKKSSIASIEREYDLHDICVMTRAGPAKALGISKMMGHLGVGADADISIYDLAQKNLTAQSIVRAFSNAAYTIKSGNIVVKNGQVIQDRKGQILWAKTSYDESLEKEVLNDLDLIFKRFYSVNLDNFLVRDDYVREGRAITPSSLRPFEMKV